MSSGPTAVVRIKAAYRDMGAKDKEIANYVLSNLQEVSRSSISDLSSHLDMADSTIFQFTKRLGYEGFRDCLAHGRERPSGKSIREDPRRRQRGDDHP